MSLSTMKQARAVWREGCVVSFQNIVGAFVGATYSYRFSIEREAEEFEAVANEKDGNGNPVAIPRKFHLHRMS